MQSQIPGITTSEIGSVVNKDHGHQPFLAYQSPSKINVIKEEEEENYELTKKANQMATVETDKAAEDSMNLQKPQVSVSAIQPDNKHRLSDGLKEKKKLQLQPTNELLEKID